MARLGYTNEDFLNIIVIYGECNKVVTRTCDTFADRYPEKPKPTHDTISRLLNNCKNLGSFTNKNKKIKPTNCR